MTAGTFLIFGALLAANALYVAAEFGAVGVRRSRVRRLSDDGHWLARRLLPHIEEPASLDRYVAASQIGITVASLLLGAYAQATAAIALAPVLATKLQLDAASAQSASIVVVLVALTAVQVVAGELIPKQIALQFPTQVALATVLPMRWSLNIFRPFIGVLNGTASALLRLFGGGPSSHRHLHSPQEISLLIAESRDGGLLEADEHKRLQRALQLSHRTAADLMVPLQRVTMLNVDTPWSDVVRAVAASPFSRLPVYSRSPQDVIGMVRVKDLIRQYLTNAEAPLGRLVRPLPSLRHDLPADRIVGALRARRAHMAIVTDAANTVVGLVTIHDVVGELLGSGVTTSMPKGRR